MADPRGGGVGGVGVGAGGRGGGDPSAAAVLPDALAASLAEWLRATVGLRAAPSDRRELERRLRAAQHDFGFSDLEEFVSWLVVQSHSRAHIEKLAARLTIGETYFFRENQAHTALRMTLLPPLLQARRASERRLRLWSAGCSSSAAP